MGDAQTHDQAAGGTAAWRLLASVFATFAALFAATLFLPHDPYVRYQQMAPTIHFRTVWSYERLHFDRTPIDVAIVGNSRLKTAISGPEMSARLSARLGRPVSVVNFAMAQEGRDAHYVLAREILATHPEVKLIVLSAIEQMPRDGHPAFRNLADPADILAAPVLINRGYLESASYLPYRQMSLFVQTMLPATFGVRRTFDPRRYAGSMLDTRSDATGMVGEAPVGDETQKDLATLRRTAHERLAGVSPPVLGAAGAGYEFRVERHYTLRIASIAAAQDVHVAFLYAPIFENSASLKEAAFYRRIGPLYSMTALAKDDRNYRDYGHLNVRGSSLAMEYLVNALSKYPVLAAADAEGDRP